MGEFAQPILAGLQVGGIGASIGGQVIQGRAAERAAKFNAEVQRLETGNRIESLMNQQRRQRATNITRVAKSGVRLSGSPLAVLAENEFNFERQEGMIRQSGELAAELSRLRGESANAATRVGIASTLVSGAGQLGSLALRHA